MASILCPVCRLIKSNSFILYSKVYKSFRYNFITTISQFDQQSYATGGSGCRPACSILRLANDLPKSCCSISLSTSPLKSMGKIVNMHIKSGIPTRKLLIISNLRIRRKLLIMVWMKKLLHIPFIQVMDAIGNTLFGSI